MKKLNLITISFFLFSFSSYSQCKTKTDAITNEKIVSYATDFRENTLLNTMKMEIKKPEITLDFSITYKGAFESSVPNGTEIVVKLSNNEILKLKTSGDAKPRVIADYSGVFTSFSYVFVLTKEMVTKIASVGCELVRFPDLKSGNLDSDKAAKHLGKGAKCLSESPEFKLN
ncbi:MAG: hypothetical protein V4635_05315 [Bacteroidota bacterium]